MWGALLLRQLGQPGARGLPCLCCSLQLCCQASPALPSAVHLLYNCHDHLHTPTARLQGEEGEEFHGPHERYPPGRIVWARVEGHEFWPARVVRRRAGAHAGSATLLTHMAAVVGVASRPERQCTACCCMESHVSCASPPATLLCLPNAYASACLSVQCRVRWAHPLAAPTLCAPVCLWCSSPLAACLGSCGSPQTR